MTVLLVSRQADVCGEIAARLRALGHIVSAYDEPEPFFRALETSGFAVHAICADYAFFDLATFSLFAFLNERGLCVPVIFYNDPFPAEDPEALWLGQNRACLSGFAQRDDATDFALLCSQVNGIVRSPDVRPYVSLITPPPPYRKDAASAPAAFSAERFRLRHRLGPAKFRLFCYLFDRAGRPVTAQELCHALWGQYTPARQSTLYAYIHHLRACLLEEIDMRMDIVRTGTRCYALHVLEREDAVAPDQIAREKFLRAGHLFVDEAD